ncbi:hypothetical protein RhiJN_07065 [Ceratobasidium sp. AG-Ba]|nr:hypothetical protein RhiJN_07065 [Ceratobasidium sp. AG-Ba]QRW07947.1 hypothetical protein RhiLY_06946 [Ceratobasidium sp. AG-Ba]
MPFRSTTSRIALFAFVLISLGLLAHASPIAAPEASKELISVEERGQNCYGDYCYGGMDLVALMKQVQYVIEIDLAKLDGCLGGGDYVPIIGRIEGTLLAACGAIKGYNIGLIGLLTGKLLIIAKIWFAIVISIATHCGKWYGHVEFAKFCLLIAKVDLALKLCLLAIINLGGIFGGFLGICVGLFTKVHVALLIKVKFILCLGALGIPY